MSGTSQMVTTRCIGPGALRRPGEVALRARCPEGRPSAPDDGARGAGWQGMELQKGELGAYLGTVTDVQRSKKTGGELRKHERNYGKIRGRAKGEGAMRAGVKG